MSDTTINIIRPDMASGMNPSFEEATDGYVPPEDTSGNTVLVNGISYPANYTWTLHFQLGNPLRQIMRTNY